MENSIAVEYVEAMREILEEYTECVFTDTVELEIIAELSHAKSSSDVSSIIGSYTGTVVEADMADNMYSAMLDLY